MSQPVLKVKRVVVTILIVYGLFLICGCAWQRKLLYFPTTLPAGDVAAASARSGLEPWRNPAGEIIGWKLAASAPATGSVLVMHGNGGCALQRGYLARPIHDAAALDVFILEYPGYGMRDGSPSLKSLAGRHPSMGRCTELSRCCRLCVLPTSVLNPVVHGEPPRF